MMFQLWRTLSANHLSWQHHLTSQHTCPLVNLCYEYQQGLPVFPHTSGRPHQLIQPCWGFSLCLSVTDKMNKCCMLLINNSWNHINICMLYKPPDLSLSALPTWSHSQEPSFQLLRCPSSPTSIHIGRYIRTYIQGHQKWNSCKCVCIDSYIHCMRITSSHRYILSLLKVYTSHNTFINNDWVVLTLKDTHNAIPVLFCKYQSG